MRNSRLGSRRFRAESGGAGYIPWAGPVKIARPCHDNSGTFGLVLLLPS
jgi:hypothetical protein